MKAYQVTERNYEKALTSSKKAYDNECLIFTNNISTLFSLPKTSQQSASSLRNLIGTLLSIYGSLFLIGISNAMLIYLVLNRVNTVTKRKYEEQLDYETLPHWSDFEKMFNRRYHYLSAAESHSKLLSRKSHRSSFSCSSSNSKPQQTCSFRNAEDHLLRNFSTFGRLSAIKSSSLLSLPPFPSCSIPSAKQRPSRP